MLMLKLSFTPCRPIAAKSKVKHLGFWRVSFTNQLNSRWVGLLKSYRGRFGQASIWFANGWPGSYPSQNSCLTDKNDICIRCVRRLS